jgi:hypothetical protein
MPRNPPIAPVRTEAIDSPPSPHNDGMKPPSVDPTTSPIMISDFDFIAIVPSMEGDGYKARAPAHVRRGSALAVVPSFYEGFLL